MKWRDVANLTVPAASALLGVGLTLLYTARQEKQRQTFTAQQEEQRRQAEMNGQLWVARRQTTLAMLLAYNTAFDSTRRQVAAGATMTQLDWRKAEPDITWSAAFNRYIEATLVFPDEPGRICTAYKDQCYDWRLAVSEAGSTSGRHAPKHSELATALAPWLSAPN